MLPQYYLEGKPLVSPPAKKIISLVPTTGTTWFLVGDTYDTKYGATNDDADMMPLAQAFQQPAMARRVACHALVEVEKGHRWEEPMVHVSPADQEIWMSEQPGDGQGLVYGGTLGDGDCKVATGGSARRTMLASDWLVKAVVDVQRQYDFIRASFLWTHLLVSDVPPNEFGFSPVVYG